MTCVAALRTYRAGAVEMPPCGKPGKLPERVSHSFHRAWKSGGIPTFPPRRRRNIFTRKKRRKDEAKTEFQLTDPITSSTIRTPASLRSESDRLQIGTSDRDQTGITDHLQRNTQSHRADVEQDQTNPARPRSPDGRTSALCSEGGLPVHFRRDCTGFFFSAR